MRTTDRFHLTPGMIVRMVADAAMIQLALIAALTLRWMFAAVFGNQDSEALGNLAGQFVRFYCDRAWPLTLISLIVFYLSGFYTYGRFYLGRYKALVVAQAVSQSYVLFSFISYFIAGEAWLISRPALILAWAISLGLLVGSRFGVRVYENIVRPEHEARAKAKRAGERRVLVVGGAGYIGSALLPLLLERGYHMRLLDMMVFGDEPIRSFADHPNLEIIRGDFRHVECVVQAMHDVDAVVHLGAIVGDPACNLDEDLTIDINLSATRMVAELAKAAGVERFIFASTCSVYGACDEMLDERSFVRPVSLYGHTKLASERVLRKMASDRFHPTIVRFATIYGLSGRTRFDLVVNLLSAKAKIDGKITIHGGDQWRPFVHVEDAARAVAIVLDAPREVISNEIFNVGSNDQNYTITQIGQIVHEQVISAEMVVSDGDGDHRNYRVDFKKIRNHLGFRPQWSVEEGVQQVLEAIASGEIVDYQESKYSNVKFLSEEGTERIARDRWARQLIEDLARG